MKKIIIPLLSSIWGLLIVSSCNSTSAPVVPLPIPSATSQVSVTEKTLPMPASIGQSILYDDLQVMMMQAEITTGYVTEYGSTREPSSGGKFLWVHIQLKNIGQGEINLPASEHFSALNGTSEFKSTYGHRKDYTDYTALNPILYQGEQVDAWLRFDIPTDTELQDLRFAFLPESTQVSFGFSSSDYSWANHPIYLWMCAP
jgi:hypothetical protein